MAKAKAIFLDRDGVINSDEGHYYIYKPDDFVLTKGFVEAISELKAKGYMFVVISNQGGIAKGTYSKADVEKVHAKFISLMKVANVEITEIYFCPHHSDVEACLCRKPNALMIEKAIARFNIDVENSWLIGDNKKDIEAAHSAGLRAIKIDSNQSLLSIIDKIL